VIHSGDPATDVAAGNDATVALGSTVHDKATVTEHLVRHGDYLTWIVYIDDPVYLSEPFIRTTNFVWDPHQQIAAYPCQIVEEIDRPETLVPHHLPGKNPFLLEFPAKFGVPAAAARGGAETMYPEYQLKLKTMPLPAAPPAR